VESAPTEPVCIEVKDIIPPETPTRFVGDIGVDFVELSWTASTSPDVASYRVYRLREGGIRGTVIATERPVTRLRDSDMAKGSRAYELVAVDRAGNESAPTPELKIVVP
jgi:large repetitive protein